MVEDRIIGIDEISCRMEGRSYNTLMMYKRQRNLPIFKVLGQWQAYQRDLDRWQEFQDNGVFFEDEDIPSRKKQTEIKKRKLKKQKKT